MKRMWGGVVVGLALLLAVPALAADIKWIVVSNSDCTGAGTATGVTDVTNVPCCMAAGQGYCNARSTRGQFFSNIVTIVPDVKANTYPASTLAISTAQMQKISFGNVIFARCQGASGLNIPSMILGHVPANPSVTNDFKLKLTSVTAGAAIAEHGNTNTNMDDSFSCELIGY